MQGAFILAGRVDELTIVVAPYVADNTLIVSQRTFDSIKAAFPEARTTLRNLRPVQRRKAKKCPKCQGDGNDPNWRHGSINNCDVCGGTGKVLPLRRRPSDQEERVTGNKNSGC